MPWEWPAPIRTLKETHRHQKILSQEQHRSSYLFENLGKIFFGKFTHVSLWKGDEECHTNWVPVTLDFC